MPISMKLRVVTYLAPSLPAALFEAIARYLGDALGAGVQLHFETRWSGPPPGEPDPFAVGEADVGFMCAPSFQRLAAETPSAVALLPVAPLFRDPRLHGRPGYFSEIVVASSSPARSVGDLRAARWAYNDLCSLSGYFNLRARLESIGAGEHFQRTAVRSGSHLESIALVARAEVDGAAVDSNVLRIALDRAGAGGLPIRVLESIGPCPVQPVVMRAGLPADVRAAIARALQLMHLDDQGRGALASFGLERFAPVAASDYALGRSRVLPLVTPCVRETVS